MDGPNLEAHYQTWAGIWRHRNPGVEITDADLRLRYAEWAEAEESRLSRERQRWERVNWGYPPEPSPADWGGPGIRAGATREDYLDRAEKRLRQREKATPKPPTPKPAPRPGSVPMP